MVARLRSNPWVVLFVLCLGFFMILLDTTIVNIAVPSIMISLDATLDDILWVLNSYTLVYAVLLITASRLGDKFGQRQLFLIGMALFIVSSAACGFAQTPAQLVAARVAQGIGGALLSPQTMTIITTIFPSHRRGAAFGMWGVVAGVAAVAGPTLGGFIVTNLSWHWIFFVNLPVGAIALIAAFLIVPDTRIGARHSLDLVGVALASIALFAILFGLIEGQAFNWGTVWNWLTIPEIIIFGVVVGIAFLLWERVPAEPLVPASIFKDRNFSLMNGSAAAMAFATAGFVLPITIYFQAVLGMTAQEAGLVMAPSAVVSMIVAPFSGRLTDRVGGKYILMCGFTLLAIAIAILALIASPMLTWLELVPVMALIGFAQGCIHSPQVTIAMRNVKPAMAGAASGTLNTIRQFGFVLGSAAVGAVFQNQLATHLREEAVTTASQMPAAFQQRFVEAMAEAFGGGALSVRSPSGMQLPDGIPPDLAQTVQELARQVFVNGFADAMLPTLVLPVILLLAGALSCLLAAQSHGVIPVPNVAKANIDGIAPGSIPIDKR